MQNSPISISLIQTNPIVGDIYNNSKHILDIVSKSKSTILAFPEMSLVGYPVEDLAFRFDFIEDSQKEVESLAKIIFDQGFGDKYVLIGAPSMNIENITNENFFKSDDISKSKLSKPYNSCYILHNGKVLDIYHKKQLPNYGVFDDFRIWTAGKNDTILQIEDKKIAIIICEDIWQSETANNLKDKNIDGTICINASVYEIGKPKLRYKVVEDFSRITNAPVFYINLVGSQDGLVFEGGSFAMDINNQKIIESPKFIEYELSTDLLLTNGNTYSSNLKIDEMSETYQALILGLKDYVQKSGFKKVILGLSGGIDSALVATIAVDALGSENVLGVRMPSIYSSKGSLDDAEELAKNLKLENLQTLSIENYLKVFDNDLKLSGLAAENIQARIRGLILMSLSNKYDALVLATGNKSELAIGYSTIFGDSVGAYAPIMDLTKTRVFEFANWRNKSQDFNILSPIPSNSITKPPSAELRPNQKDEDTIGKYEILDKLIEDYIELRKYPDSKELKELALKIDKNEYKRRLYPIGTKVTKMAFNKDRRLPIVNRF